MNSTKTIEIKARSRMRSLVLLEDSRHLLSADDEGVIRQWRWADGMEVGEGIRVSGGLITAITLSDDGNWILSAGWQVANVLSRKSPTGFTVNEHTDWVDTVHVSPDSTRFATGGNDKKVFIWDISTGKQLVGPLEHDDRVRTVKFSPTGDRIATSSKCLRVYNANNGDLLQTFSSSNIPYTCSNLIAWSGVHNVFTLTSQNTLAHVHVNAKQTLSSWSIPGEAGGNFGYIALSSNGKFIASSIGRSISLWDTATYAQICSAITHPAPIWSIALSFDNDYLATSDANGIITLRNLKYIIPDYYLIGQIVVQQSQAGRGAEQQTDALRTELRVPSLHFNQLRKTTIQVDDRLQVQVIPPRILDGTYYIKNNTGDLYLTCSQAAPGSVFMQRLDQSNVHQRWAVSLLGDGIYKITTRKGNQDIPLTTGNANVLVSPDLEYTTWTIEPRGDAYVIGNASDATAIHRTQDHTVSVLLRNNTPNQRWVFERVAD
ncbi:quinon protein alcohol dehydrogenase-like superfamily [Boletus reticuloceps]|uniref:Quinon protein alcohol dehydrogenase-like superfamily n=1 Tax=Boletus reticuloceps TaxID=495285 RepID=A0A8I2YIR4_9AGAM|nr:quinon protein alcohol dehydrogenase-like superfamily [Boletus reticuloceps]